MSYRNIEPILIELDKLTSICGLFSSEKSINNYYNCKSKSKAKQEPNCCYGFDCPLAYEATLSDLKKYDKHLYEEYLHDFKDRIAKGEKEEDCYLSEIGGSYWMIQFREIV